MSSARRFATIALALLLSGCWWQGPAFYKGDPHDAGPVTPGWYKFDLLGDHKPAVTEHIDWLPDGGTRSTPRKVTRKNGIVQFMTARLTVPGRDLWVMQMPSDDKPEDGAIYGLLERHGDQLAFTFPLDCDSNVAIVKAAGGTVSGGQEEVLVTDTGPTVDGRMGRGTKSRLPKVQPQTIVPASMSRRTNQECTFSDRPSLERALIAFATAHPQLDHIARLKRLGD